MPSSQGPENIDISATEIGQIAIAPPTFLERWGVVFLAYAGAWILVVGTSLLIYFFWKQPALPQHVRADSGSSYAGSERTQAVVGSMERIAD